ALAFTLPHSAQQRISALTDTSHWDGGQIVGQQIIDIAGAIDRVHQRYVTALLLSLQSDEPQAIISSELLSLRRFLSSDERLPVRPASAKQLLQETNLHSIIQTAIEKEFELGGTLLIGNRLAGYSVLLPDGFFYFTESF